MIPAATRFEWIKPGFHLAASLVPWDTDAFGFPVAQIDLLRIDEAGDAAAHWEPFREWLLANGVRIASCRLPMNRHPRRSPPRNS